MSMTLRPPGNLSANSLAETGFDALGYEILAEKAAALGRAGERAEICLRRLKRYEHGAEGRTAMVREAAEAVYAWFIQRELCGLRRHDDVIREYAIPKEVLVRLGAK
jgi:hypothetical protein